MDIFFWLLRWYIKLNLSIRPWFTLEVCFTSCPAELFPTRDWKTWSWSSQSYKWKIKKIYSFQINSAPNYKGQISSRYRSRQKLKFLLMLPLRDELHLNPTAGLSYNNQQQLSPSTHDDVFVKSHRHWLLYGIIKKIYMQSHGWEEL